VFANFADCPNGVSLDIEGEVGECVTERTLVVVPTEKLLEIVCSETQTNWSVAIG
jgi:hypothetical protein